MTRAVTERYDEMTLRVETDTPGTFATICGLMDVKITRVLNVGVTEVPDCDDESIPSSEEIDAMSISVSVDASGVWARDSASMMLEWFYSASMKKIRLVNSKAAVGDLDFEAGDALLVGLDHSRTKGKKVSAEVKLRFDGVPTTHIKT